MIVKKQFIETEIIQLTRQEYEDSLKEFYNKGRKSFAKDLFNIIIHFEHILNIKGVDILCTRLLNVINNEINSFYI